MGNEEDPEVKRNGHITVYKDSERNEDERYCIMCGLIEEQCAVCECDRHLCPPPGK